VKRQVFIQIRPVQAKRGNLDMIQLLARASRQTRIFRNRKTNLPATFPNRSSAVWLTRKRDDSLTRTPF
jgi:hypothetical protein